MHLRRHTLITQAFALSAITAGVLLSIIDFLNTEWIARSGSLLVIVGVMSSLNAHNIEAYYIKQAKHNA